MLFIPIIWIGDFFLRFIAAFLRAMPGLMPNWLLVSMRDMFEYMYNLQGLFPIVRNPASYGGWGSHGIIDDLLILLVFYHIIFALFLLMNIFGAFPLLSIGRLLKPKGSVLIDNSIRMSK